MKCWWDNRCLISQQIVVLVMWFLERKYWLIRRILLGIFVPRQNDGVNDSKTTTITPTVTNQGTATITYTSSNTSVATISETTITAKAPGTTKIKATVDGVNSTEITLTVNTPQFENKFKSFLFNYKRKHIRFDKLNIRCCYFIFDSRYDHR